MVWVPFHQCAPSPFRLFALSPSRAAGIRISQSLRDIINRRRAVRVECVHGLQTPSLAFRAFGLVPHHGLPIRIQNQIATRADLESVSARLITIQKESLPDRMFVRASFDKDAVFNENIGSS